ncbi:hypothetical protein ANCCAN_22312 [Ancylostoma caninum]|uniref:Uncharacterized protein n=1 Tax=Ancylostoma caninum TaxID=29170 RepID=A0A368FID2_ANCCA|nr:hypothetical protein ANCCAN_22312 [Ancylostoma caninum]
MISLFVSIFPSAPPPDMVEQRYMNRFEGAQQYGNPYPQNAPPCPHPPYIPPRYPHPPYVQPPFPDPHVALPYPHPPHIMPFFPPFGPNHGPINPSQPEVVIKEEPQDFNGPPPPKRARGFNVDEILEDEDDSDDEVDDSDDDVSFESS